jgi:hypothetical protein
MSRNHYTRVVHEEQRRQIARQEKRLAALEDELNHKDAESTAVPFIDKAKEHRRARLEQKRRHKPERFRTPTIEGS